jgi:phage shock protein A
MGIMTRIVRLWKADLHGVMDQLEDKGLLLRQYLREMEHSLHQKETRCTQLNQECGRIAHDMKLRRKEMEASNQDLELAIVKSKDDIARMLIRKRRSLEAMCTQLQQQLDMVNEEHQHLEALVGQQRLQYEQLKIKAEVHFQQFQARQHVADVPEFDGPHSFPSLTEEEIELELLQRKERMNTGGAV